MKMQWKQLALGVLACAIAVNSSAQDADTPWVLRFGAHIVDPTSNNGYLAGAKTSVSSSTRPTFSIEYMLTPQWGFEALAALPFQHTLRLNGQRAATVKQLPPVLGVNYHFLAGSAVSPFVGLGVNYTHFYDANGVGPLFGAHVVAKDSWGAAAHGGVDFRLSERWVLTADVRWMDIRSKVRVNGAYVGTTKIDPLAYGLSVGWRF
jgi:outer membrane protein